MTILLMPNNKMCYTEVLAANKKWASRWSQRQFLHSCNMVVQNLLKNNTSLKPLPVDPTLRH